MKLLISDTCDVVITRKRDNHVFVTAEAQLASISATLGIDEKIFGGIGNKALSTIRGQKEVSSSVRNAFYDQEFLAMTQGVEIVEGQVNVHKREDAVLVEADDLDGLQATIVGTPIGNEVTLRNTGGDTESTTVSEQVIVVPEGLAEEGEFVSVTYLTEVTGDITALDSEKFSEAHRISFNTIAYDPNTNLVVKDIYIQLDHVIPSGEFELSFENGSAIAPEINFEAMVAPNTTEIGRVIEVDREV